MRPLRLNRYKQDAGHCWIAACASVANYHNKKVNYNLTKHVTHQEVMKYAGDGGYSGDIGMLLNSLGFKKVTIYTCDLESLDYSWAKLSKRDLIDKMDKVVKSRCPAFSPDAKGINQSFRDFLRKDKFVNNVNIDHHFSNHIREALDYNLPIVISINWTMYFHMSKSDNKNPHVKELAKSYPAYHAVAARGYNDKEVHIVDSHWEYYKRHLKRFREGFYKIPWEELMTVMGSGDVIVAEDYDESLLNYELV